MLDIIDLEDPTLTNQRLITEVLDRLQNVNNWGRSEHRRDGDPRCAYRGDDDLCCAAGWVIPTRLYTQTLEGKRIRALTEESPTLRAYVGPFVEVLADLQDFHDDYMNTNRHNHALLALGSKYLIDLSDFFTAAAHKPEYASC